MNLGGVLFYGLCCCVFRLCVVVYCVCVVGVKDGVFFKTWWWGLRGQRV